MSNGHIIIVEDEKDISDLLSLQLQTHGFTTEVYDNGERLLDTLQNKSEEFSKPSLFILDRMLPGTDGLTLCKFLRLYKETKKTPILMVTAMTSPENIVEGLDAGADDYVTKPFDMNILMARVRSLIRRGSVVDDKEQISDKVINYEGIRIDLEQCKVWVENEEVDLTLSEYKLLGTFIKNPGKVFTRNQLMNIVQEGPVHVTERTIDTHIFGLRKKLGPYSNMIETIRGIGYRAKNA